MLTCMFTKNNNNYRLIATILVKFMLLNPTVIDYKKE